MSESMIYTAIQAMKAAMAGCTAQDMQQFKTSDEMLEHLARAVIGSMRDPPKGLQEAAQWGWANEDLVSWWNGLIDEALK